MTTNTTYFLGIDVGTGSARSGVVSEDGTIVASSTKEIKIWKPKHDYYEQSSDDIWDAICTTVGEALKKSGVKPEQIKGIGFDATCSLVALDKDDKPVSLSPSGNDQQNIIVWMDHRSMDQTARINATHHNVLNYVGGIISPEMETPKLLWVKENMPEQWKKTAQFFDLPDFLSYRATGDNTRSLCTVVCKWTYMGHENKWDDSYFRQIGLGDLVDEGYVKIGKNVRPMGEPVGKGLTEKAAKELGLLPGTPVGVSIIDAHAGGLGVLGAVLPGGVTKVDEEELEKRLAVISGTSTCHMAVNRKPVDVRGVWGPYFSAMVPGLWLSEGGESATGALIDHVLFSHAAASGLKEKATQAGSNIYVALNTIIQDLAKKQSLSSYALLSKNFHMLPYYHGNRSPRADPVGVGMLSGLKLASNLEEDLAIHYLVTIQAIAYGTRHIIESMNQKGHKITTLFVTGGNAKNELFLQEHANITGCRVILSRESDAVILGASILGAVAGGAYPDVVGAMSKMCAAGRIVEPDQSATIKDYHQAKYEIFLSMYEHELLYRAKMEKFGK